MAAALELPSRWADQVTSIFKRTSQENAPASSRAAVQALKNLAVAFQVVTPLADSDAREADDETRASWERILQEIDRAACQLRLTQADRSYRSSFTNNYQALFPSPQRHYRLDLLLASVERQEYIWLNGTRFDIGARTMELAQTLHLQVRELHELVTCRPGHHEQLAAARQLPRMLAAFDAAWAAFEHRYINELESIEKAGRGLLVECAEAEAALRALETNSSSLSGFPPQQMQMNKTREDDPFMFCHAQERDCEALAATLTIPVQCIGTPTARDASLRAAARSLGSEAGGNTCQLLQGQSLRSQSSDVRNLAVSAASAASAVRRQTLKALTVQVARLNACANQAGRGREDLGMEVLEAAANVLLKPELVQIEELPDQKQIRITAAAARRTLASKVLKTFAALRNHLAELATALDHVDPQLSNNSMLASRLRDWEEAWEMGSRHLMDPSLLAALCGVAAVVVAAKRFSPRLREACDDQDSELFLILPRLVWLCALADPHRYAALPASLLPHHFPSKSTIQLPFLQKNSLPAGPEDLQLRFRNACSELSGSRLQSTTCCGPLWELLVTRAVSGAASPVSSEATGLEELMRHLEGRSMELQRHVPEDWNQCCSVLLECVAAASDAQSLERS